MRPSRLRAALTAVAMLPVLAWTLFPIYWITTASFKTELALYARPPQWLFTPIFDNYTRVLTNIPFAQYLKNSLVIAIGTTSSLLPSVGIVSTLAGCDSTLHSLASDAAVTCAIMKPELTPASRDRKGGSP